MSYTYHFKKYLINKKVPCVMQTKSKHHAVMITNVLGFGIV